MTRFLILIFCLPLLLTLTVTVNGDESSYMGKETQNNSETGISGGNIDVAQLSLYLSNLNENLSQMAQQLKMTQKELAFLKLLESVPIGFIYIQYSAQSEPTQLWPQIQWLDVTSSYAGQFFRALGGQSAAFGLTQEQAVPRISSVQTHQIVEGTQIHLIDIPVTTASSDHHLFSGANNGGDFWGMQFHVTGNEVRPSNQAVKIWKRIN